MTTTNTKLSPQDADLLPRVGIALVLSRRSGLSLTVRVAHAEVTLAGELPTFFERQFAVELIRRIAGVRRVHDEITVADEPVLPYARFAEPAAVVLALP